MELNSEYFPHFFQMTRYCIRLNDNHFLAPTFSLFTNPVIVWYKCLRHSMVPLINYRMLQLKWRIIV